MKSAKNIARDVLRAHGIWNVEPNDEAIKVIRDYAHENWVEGDKSATYDMNFND